MSKDPMPTFHTIEDAALYGIPREVDGVALSRLQMCQVFPRILQPIMDDAGWPLKEAVDLAVDAFKRSYKVHGNVWKAEASIKLGRNHGGTVHNRFHDADRRDHMARERAARAERAKPMWRRALTEAGARNSRKDKSAIKEVIARALGLLSKDEVVDTLRDAGYEVGDHA